MAAFSQKFPPVLSELHELEFDYEDGEGIDFEPYQEFQSADDNAAWFKAWTGNDEVDGSEYRVFGQDGTGGYAAFWLVREGKPILEQPIVFFGSEGELGIVAASFSDYLWLLAGGFGPLEAVEYPEDDRSPSADFTEFAGRNAPGDQKSPREVLSAAKAEFPGFVEQVRALCK
ncbi:MAG TPA: hypothetical protein VNO33_07895 [Kofleriaceae bacterium]|nr:hypothetical protein [Kofleriaceae bacterium]